MLTNQNEIDLDQIAFQAMLDRGFIPDFPPPVLDELGKIGSPPAPHFSYRDLRHLLWISIDNIDSQDLDQLTFAEKTQNGTYKLYVAVADVSGTVQPDSHNDLRAQNNTTSIYTPTVNFPMLHPKLSTNMTSLNEKVDRNAVVVEMEIDAEGKFELLEVYLAVVYNHAKLAYPTVSEWLEYGKPLPSISEEVHDQLKLQDLISNKIQHYRDQLGTLNFGTIEVQPIIENRVPVALTKVVADRGHKLIENCMIAANSCLSKYLTSQNIPILKRIVKKPRRWEKIVEIAQGYKEFLPEQPDAKALQNFLFKQSKADPLRFPDLSLTIIKLIGRGEYAPSYPGNEAPGHFDLALEDYAHTTAPNRRYPDLIMQRLLKSFLQGQPSPYSDRELQALAQRCTKKEGDADKVERHLKKSAAAMALRDQIGKIFSAIVTGSSSKGTWVRLLHPPVEGKLVRGFKHLDVGDRIEVELLEVDIAHGYLDFARYH
ncbi:RNB domain-containing ribonuclease [Parachlamydia sp. AcF125]|uniref:RNB domain-containing ribonuclease n=1 Tax=Parachlamydia sp. AcF125 TaxID=2795736 RepID=UPI001BCA26FF|nr:RNB domain-containing ribonuclease [Parachlamydia sp. AcF125]MBS4169267.1 Ribonuclease R [Parachlamydia sp. AcF125]